MILTILSDYIALYVYIFNYIWMYLIYDLLFWIIGVFIFAGFTIDCFSSLLFQSSCHFYLHSRVFHTAFFFTVLLVLLFYSIILANVATISTIILDRLFHIIGVTVAILHIRNYSRV